jgi:flagellin
LASAPSDTVVSDAAATDITIAIGQNGTPKTISSSANFAITGDIYHDETSAYAKAAAIDDAGIFGLIVSASTSGTSGALAGDVVTTTAADTDYSIDINGVTVSATILTGDALTGNELADMINGVSQQTGVIAAYDATTGMTLTAADGRNIVVDNEIGADNAIAAVDFAAAAVVRGSLTLTASDSMTLAGTTAEIGYGTTTDIPVDISEGINDINITDLPGANEAMLRVDAALATVDSSRGELGAIQNRFESTISNLQNVAENLTAARSRIRDADIAQETSEMTKANILQQAGVSILTQANQTPQLALQLLQG